jgi:solute carrier family 31 (copper transporter), member 1
MRYADNMNAKGLPVSSSQPDLKKQASSSTAVALRDAAILRNAPPFIASHDIVRGIAYAGHSLLQFAFMLVIM